LAYATLQDLITRFSERRLIQLTDRFVPPAEVIDESVTAEALQHAGDLIDGYVRAIYALPFQTVPPLLNGLACDIAYFRLFQEPTEEARKRYEDALRDAPSRPDVIRATAQTRLFSRDTLTGL
jgi:phage gp36-like protein